MFDKPKYKVTVSSKTEFDETFKKKFVFVPYNIIYADDVKYLPNGIEIHTHTENMRDNIRTEYSAFVPKKYVEKIDVFVRMDGWKPIWTKDGKVDELD